MLAATGGVPFAQLTSLVTNCQILSGVTGDPLDGRGIAGASWML